MVGRFDLTHARHFLDFYATDEKIRYGVHLYLLRKLMEYDLVYEEIDIYIDASLAHTLNPLLFFTSQTDQGETYINVDQTSIDKYAAALCPAYAQKHPILSGQNTKPSAYQTISNILENLSANSEAYKTVGRSVAFYEATQLLKGHDDWVCFHHEYGKYKIQMSKNQSSDRNDEIEDEDLLYEMDRIDQQVAAEKTFPHWPINKITDLPLYACKGYRNNNTREFGFFTELINLDAHNNEPICHIVALGFPEGDPELDDKNLFDFSNYFSMTTNYDIEIPNAKASNPSKTKIITIQVNPDNGNGPKKISEKIDEYFLTLKAIDKSDDSVITEKMIHIINVKAKDMTAIKFKPEEATYFYGELLTALEKNEGVLVHCMAGLGRTGQIIAELYTLAKNSIPKIIEMDFNAGKGLNYPKIARELGKLINSLRECRPGLILTEEQLLQSVENAINYLALQNDCKPIETQQTVGNNNDNQKKRKHDDTINPTKTSDLKLFKPKQDDESVVSSNQQNAGPAYSKSTL